MVGCALIENLPVFIFALVMGSVAVMPWVMSRHEKLTRDEEE